MIVNRPSDTIPYVMFSKSLVVVVASDTTSIPDMGFSDYHRCTIYGMV